MPVANNGKQSYPSIIAALRLGSISFIQRDYDALVPFLRNLPAPSIAAYHVSVIFSVALPGVCIFLHLPFE